MTDHTIELVPLADLAPAAINDRIYKPVSEDDPAVVRLADRIRKNGLLQPIVVTADNVILSGHRRRVACRLAGLTEVRVQREDIRSTDPRFAELLVDFNDQRVKCAAEQLREAIVTADPDEAYAALRQRQKRMADRLAGRVADADLAVITPAAARRRSEISAAKRPMLAAVKWVLGELEDYWPVTLRQVHYRLLNDPPPRHANRPHQKYANDKPSYQDLSDLLTRARLAGEVSWHALHDPTRPQTEWRLWADTGPFVREQRDEFLAGYRRDLLQSQPAYAEVIGEKMTVQAIAEGVAGEYGVPVCIGRGYSSIDARYHLARRFARSGKDRLTLLVLSDLDPEGENIGETLAGSLRDEFHIEHITTVKVALTPQQVREHRLPAVMAAKATSSRAKGYTAKHGTAVYELEALPPAVLEGYVREAIETVLDMDLFRAELERAKADAAELEAIRRQVQDTLAGALPD